jgi:hypothetical protein
MHRIEDGRDDRAGFRLFHRGLYITNVSGIGYERKKWVYWNRDWARTSTERS